MASLSFILGMIGNVISVLMFASPILLIYIYAYIQSLVLPDEFWNIRKTFKEVVKKKSTENYKGLPYIITLLSTCLWAFYGILKPGGLLIITVNGIGAAIHIVYVALFLIYAPKNIKFQSVKLVAALNVGFLGVVIAVALLAFHGGLRLTIAGLLCAGFTIGMYAAPLSVMRTVIQLKSVRYMPFSLSFFQFLNGAAWSAYAVVLKDFYVGVPNGIGFLLGLAQLILYVIYNGKQSNEEDSEQKMEDEGSAHLFKGATQIQSLDEDNIKILKNSLHKENSLPRPAIARQYSQNIVKTRSLSPYELQKHKEEDIEKGF